VSPTPVPTDQAKAESAVEDETIASIGAGIVVLVGCEKGDGEEEVKKTVKKVLETRVFANEAGALWERNVSEVDGEVLCVSQFTLLASVAKGTKPSELGLLRKQTSNIRGKADARLSTSNGTARGRAAVSTLCRARARGTSADVAGHLRVDVRCHVGQ
jgi:D-Tyr-tRNAtyr deacylase